MEGSQNQNTDGEPTVPVQIPRGLRGFKPFRNPPQPHMCILTYIKDTVEKIYINVLSWTQIANPKHHTDPIPLYGGMQIPQGYAPNSDKGLLLVFAVMVNPEILKVNGKNATNQEERDAFVNLLCDFVVAMNPNLHLTGKASVLKDRDFAGELKDVWVAVQTRREREKVKIPNPNSDVTHKIYHIDGPSNTNTTRATELNPEYLKDPPQDSKAIKSNQKNSIGESPRLDLVEQNHPTHNLTLNHQRDSLPNRIVTDEVETLDRKAANHNSNSNTEFSYKAFRDNIINNTYNLKTNTENEKSVNENRHNNDLPSQICDATQPMNVISNYSNNVSFPKINSNISESKNITESTQNDRLKENGNASSKQTSASHIPVKTASVKRKNSKPADINLATKNFYPVFDNPVGKPETEKPTAVASVGISEKQHLIPIIPMQIKNDEKKQILSANDDRPTANNIMCGNSESKQMTIINTKNTPNYQLDKQSNINASHDQTVPSNSDVVKFLEKLHLPPNNSSEANKNNWNSSAKEPQTTLSSK